MTIGEKIRERAQGVANTGPDWFANELYSELSEVAEVEKDIPLEGRRMSVVLSAKQ